MVSCEKAKHPGKFSYIENARSIYTLDIFLTKLDLCKMICMYQFRASDVHTKYNNDHIQISMQNYEMLWFKMTFSWTVLHAIYKNFSTVDIPIWQIRQRTLFTWKLHVNEFIPSNINKYTDQNYTTHLFQIKTVT